LDRGQYKRMMGSVQEDDGFRAKAGRLRIYRPNGSGTQACIVDVEDFRRVLRPSGGGKRDGPRQPMTPKYNLDMQLASKFKHCGNWTQALVIMD